MSGMGPEVLGGLSKANDFATSLGNNIVKNTNAQNAAKAPQYYGQQQNSTPQPVAATGLKGALGPFGQILDLFNQQQSTDAEAAKARAEGAPAGMGGN